MGYSCILFGDAVRKAGGRRYYSLERNPEFAAVIMSLVDLAGLSDLVKVVVGSSDESVARLHSFGALKHIDLMFLDHYKPAYTTDLKLCEELKLVTPGSVLAADNVIKPGNPPYLEYVRGSVEEKRKKFKENRDGVTVEGIAERTVKQYANKYSEEKFSQSQGNPNLAYDSKLVNSYEPTGVPVSFCLFSSAMCANVLVGWHRDHEVYRGADIDRLAASEQRLSMMMQFARFPKIPSCILLAPHHNLCIRIVLDFRQWANNRQ